MSTIKVNNLQNPSATSAALVLNTDGTCSQLGVRNAIINGNPIINQRGYVSGTATSGANQYTLDRWRVVTSGQSITFTDSANVRTVTAPAGGCEQVVEGLNLITGTYTLNWTGTATATVAGNAVAKGGNVSITGGTDTTVRFSSGTFSLVQFEPGTVATPFERRSYGQELALCQRYYQKSYETGTAPGTATSAGISFVGIYNPGVNTWNLGIQFVGSMRTAPSISYWDAAGNASKSSYTGNGNTTFVNNNSTAASGPFNISTSGLTWQLTASTIGTYYVQYTASAEL
jgi:hypothetical protein